MLRADRQVAASFADAYHASRRSNCVLGLADCGDDRFDPASSTLAAERDRNIAT